MINKIIAIQGDHPSSLNPKTDTSIFLAQEIQRKKYKIFFYEPKNLSIINSKVIAEGYFIKFNYNKKKFFKILKKKKMNLIHCRFILIRQNPPFNLNYITTTYILDTSVYLTESSCIFNFGRNDIVVPLAVLQEIDNNKKRQDGAGANARRIIRIFDELRSKGNLHKGVRLATGKGLIKARSFDPKNIPADLDEDSNDNKIIATAITELKENHHRLTPIGLIIYTKKIIKIFFYIMEI